MKASGSSSVQLLLTNLRLLDFDFTTCPITPDAFHQNSSNKAKTFEHIAHHLYRTFDPEECDQKLKRLWPAYESSQRKDFRIAIWTWIDELKQAGRLPNVVLRKSAIEDCFGAKYEETMAAVSSAVLRKHLEAGGIPGVTHTVGYRVATSTQPDLEILEALNYSYKSRILGVLRERKHRKQQYAEFNHMLDNSQAKVTAFEESLKEDEEESPEGENSPPKPPVPKISPREESRIVDTWSSNWTGDIKWLNLLLNGDSESAREPLLELPFEKAFENAHQFQDKEGRPGRKGGEVSVEGIDRLAEKQRGRVDRIRALKERFGFNKVHGAASPTKKMVDSAGVKKKGLGVAFTRHLEMNPGNMVVSRRRRASQGHEFSELLRAVQDEILLINGGEFRGDKDTTQPPPERTITPEAYSSPSKYCESTSFYEDDPMELDSPGRSFVDQSQDYDCDDTFAYDPPSFRQPSPHHSTPKIPSSHIKPPSPRSVAPQSVQYDELDGTFTQEDSSFQEQYESSPQSKQKLAESPIKVPTRSPVPTQPQDSDDDANERFSDDEDDVFLSLGISPGVHNKLQNAISIDGEEQGLIKTTEHVESQGSGDSSRYGAYSEDEEMGDAPPLGELLVETANATPLYDFQKERVDPFKSIPKLEPKKSVLGSGANPRMSVRQSMGFVDNEDLAERIVSSITSSANPEASIALSPWKPKVEQPPYAYQPAAATTRLPKNYQSFGHNSTSPPPHPSNPRFNVIDSPTSSSFELPNEQDTTALTVDGSGNTSGASMPGGGSPIHLPPRATTPKEELLESMDPMSVFKSRPKVAFSPPITPSPGPGGGRNRIPSLHWGREE